MPFRFTVFYMAIPEGVLTPDETVMIDIRPHWVTFANPAALAFVGFILWCLAAMNFDGFFVKALGFLFLVTLFRLGLALVPWYCTCFAVTSERIIVRKGVFAKHGVEIPLDRINTVFFEQTVVERLLKAGDLIVESASESGRQTFENISHPNDVQQMIYRAKEMFQEREHQRQGAAIAKEFGPSPFTQPTSVGHELKQLWALCQSGGITQEEYETLKASVIANHK